MSLKKFESQTSRMRRFSICSLKNKCITKIRLFAVSAFSYRGLFYYIEESEKLTRIAAQVK